MTFTIPTRRRTTIKPSIGGTGFNYTVDGITGFRRTREEAQIAAASLRADLARRDLLTALASRDEDPNNTFRGDFAGFAENH